MVDLSFNLSQVNRLATDLGHGNKMMVVEAHKILEVGANKIKKGMVKDAKAALRSQGHARRFPSSITYDQHGLSVEIGPDKRLPQGALGNLIYFGSANNAPVIADFAAPWRAEALIAEKFLADLASKSVL